MVLTYSPIAQLVERLTVNQLVPGSSPGRGAKFEKPTSGGLFFALETRGQCRMLLAVEDNIHAYLQCYEQQKSASRLPIADQKNATQY